MGFHFLFDNDEKVASSKHTYIKPKVVKPYLIYYQRG